MSDLAFQLVEGRAPRTAEIRERMQAPIPAGVKQALADRAIRKGGPGSIADQYARQAEMSRSVSSMWKRTQPFGRQPAPKRTLHRSGALESAWTGGPGAITDLASDPYGVAVGVDTRRFPQAAMLQRQGVTMIRVTPKMRAYVGLTFGVWFKRTTTRLKVEGRPVSMNREILGRARTILQRHYLRGEVAA